MKLFKKSKPEYKRAVMLERLLDLKKTDGTWEQYNKRVKEQGGYTACQKN